jgi:hypothetical protein
MNGLRQTLAAHGLRLPIFLFLFLPLVLAGYFGLPRRWGNAVLLVSSLCFHIWGEGLYAAIVLSSIAFSWPDLIVRRPLPRILRAISRNSRISGLVCIQGLQQHR